MIIEKEAPTPVGSATRAYRVLHVLDHSWPVLSGYSVRSRGLVEAQQRIGLQPSVLTGPLHQLDDHAASDIVSNAVSYVRTPLTPGLARHSMEKRWPILREAFVVRLLRQRILSLARTGKFDVIHAHSPALCGMAGLQAAHAANLPFVYEIRAFWEDAAVDQKKTQQQAIRYRATRFLEDYVVRRADAVVGIATHILQDLRSRGIDPRKLFHVSNGVDADLFPPPVRDHQLASELNLNGSTVLGFAGSLYHYEGISWLVRALAELRRRGVSCKLLVLGDGEDVPAIRAAIQETGSQDYVLALGRVPHNQIQRYYSVMDVLVYPRRSNRLTELVTPLKPLEAMAQNKPVLASSVGGIRELVDDENTGLLFKSEDLDDFCRQASRIVLQPELRRQLAQRGREMILRERDWKVLAERYRAAYDFATAAHRKR